MAIPRRKRIFCNKNGANNGHSNIGNGQNSLYNRYDNRYGQCDIYYSDNIAEQNELALPKNIFCEKKEFTFFLSQNYGRYELSDYVLSTHECIEEKTEKDFVANVGRISVANNNNENNQKVLYPKMNENNEINKCIKTRFRETDIGLTQKDFSAFAKLHHSYLNLNEEIKLIENDNMKKQGYAFYSHLPQNICQQSLNPKQLSDQNINDDLLLPLT